MSSENLKNDNEIIESLNKSLNTNRSSFDIDNIDYKYICS
jgi:hypothetical protein